MTVTLKHIKGVHRKSLEPLTPLPTNTTAGGFIVNDTAGICTGGVPMLTYYVASATSVWSYNPSEDSWGQLPSPALGGVFGAGACGEFRSLSAPGGVQTITATGGTTTTIVTNLTLVQDLAGTEIRAIAGTGMGYEGTIKSNTIGANATITVTTPSANAFSATTQFRMYAGSLWVLSSGTFTAASFRVWDRATNTWTTRSQVNLPASWGTEGQLVSTPGRESGAADQGLATGTATAGSTTTITATANWPVNGWTNAQVRITAGTGVGQIRAIASNTSNVLTVSTAWTVTPDATSVFRIAGNSDYMYLGGNNAVTMYRYTISTDTWAVLAPTAARAAAAGSGGTFDWIDEVTDPTWNDGNYGVHVSSPGMVRQNGRYIYSFRGNGSNVLDVYDIAANTWLSAIPYGDASEVIPAGSFSINGSGGVYIQVLSGRVLKLEIARNRLIPWSQNVIPQGATINGDKMAMVRVQNVTYIYTLNHTRTEFSRWLVI